MNRIFRIKELTETQKKQLAAELDGGAVAAFPTDTVYGLGTNAFDEQAIARIYQIKQRPAGAALQILLPTLARARELVQWNDAAERLAAGCWPGALTLVLPANEKGKPLLRGFAGLGLRVPEYEPLQDLLSAMQAPLACTSANVHGQAPITAEYTLEKTFATQADFILTDGVLGATASSVVDVTGETPQLLREGGISRARLESILSGHLK